MIRSVSCRTFLAGTFSIALCAALVVPANVYAQACPGKYNGAFGRFAQRIDTAAGPLYQAITMTGCTGVPVGTMAPTMCDFGFTSTSETGYVTATWPSTAARSAAGTMDGCQFMCGVSINCFVRATDGLPVELLKFGID